MSGGDGTTQIGVEKLLRLIITQEAILSHIAASTDILIKPRTCRHAQHQLRLLHIETNPGRLCNNTEAFSSGIDVGIRTRAF